jgi:hypothetical protein
MASSWRPFNTVRITAIREDRFSGRQVFHERLPRVGDVGVVVEAYESPEPAFEVECSDPATGATVWLEALYPDEIEESPGASATP